MTEKKGYLYYEIRPTERLFKQVLGLLYYMHLAYDTNKILVLPFFKLGEPLPNKTEYKYYKFSDIFDWEKMQEAPIEFLLTDTVPNPKKYSPDDLNNSIHLNVTSQLPYWFNNHAKWRKYLRFNNRFINMSRINISKALLKNKISQYLGVHWRQNDFLRVRSYVTMNAKELVTLVKERLQETALKHVYIATDCKSQEDLEYIHANLPTFTIDSNGFHNEETKEIDNVYVSLLDIMACTESTYFIGTYTSCFTSYIAGERDILRIPSNKTEQYNNNKNKIKL